MKFFLNKISYILFKISLIGVEDDHEFEQKSKILLLFIVIITSFVVTFSFSLVAYSSENYLVALVDFATCIILVFSFFYLRKTYNHLFVSFLMSIILGAIFQFFLIYGGAGNIGFIWTLIYPTAILFYFGMLRGIIISLVFLVLAVFFLSTISVYKSGGINFLSRYVSIYLVITTLSFLFELIKEDLIKRVRNKNSILEEKVFELQKKDIALTKAKLEAENADRLKSEFLAQMSHEIRTPINTILNYTSLLKSEFSESLSNELSGSFESINNASARLIRTIDLILDLSSIESGAYEPKFEKLNLADDLIIPVINEFRRSAYKKNLELNFENKISGCKVLLLDKYTITQTLTNLVHNALKYTPKGSITIRLNNQNGNVVIEVSDTGIGIAKEYFPRLFEKFSQETEGYTRSYEGSGLGLALVKKYCEINNAAIKVESMKGAGTTIWIEFTNS